MTNPPDPRNAPALQQPTMPEANRLPQWFYNPPPVPGDAPIDPDQGPVPGFPQPAPDPGNEPDPLPEPDDPGNDPDLPPSRTPFPDDGDNPDVDLPN